MRDTERIERIMNLIKQIWLKQPDFRFMQLMEYISWDYSQDHEDRFKEYSYSKWEQGGVIQFRKDVVNVDCFHLEDDELEKQLVKYLNELS